MANYKKLKHGNSLIEKRPEIAIFWDYEKNIEFTPETVSKGSTYEAHWKCERGHRWQQALAKITKHEKFHGCPVCNGVLIQKGVNDLFTLCPEIEKAWNWEKNSHIDPYSVKINFQKPIWLTCANGHELYKTLYLKKGDGVKCVYCYGKKAFAGENDLASRFPEIAKELHPILNRGKTAQDYTFGSFQKVWWLCEKGHEWEAGVSTRTRKKNNNCPVCGNRKLLTGYNDLQTRYPELAEEFDIEKNGCLPSEIKAGGAVRLWWICNDDPEHRWETLLNNRISSRSGCPYCKLGSTSKIETAIRKEIFDRGLLLGMSENFANKIHITWKKKTYMMVDIAGHIMNQNKEQVKIVVEYDGAWWHENKEDLDMLKTKLLNEHGYHVIRVREGRLQDLIYKHPMFSQIHTPHSNLSKHVKVIVDSIEEEIKRLINS